MRLLIFAILAYLLYRVGKAVFRSGKEVDKGKNVGVFDEMVQDPFCKTYIPRRESVKKVMEGEEYFFCSKNCADKFEQEGKG